jgi:H+-transporting ATPase
MKQRKTPTALASSRHDSPDLEGGGGPVQAEAMDDGGDFTFAPHSGLSSDDVEMLLRRWGRNELPEKVVPKWYVFLQILCEPMPLMIWLAAIIEAILFKWMDMTILLGIQMANASIAFYETTKAGDAVAALKASLKPEATVCRNGTWRKVDASILVPGDKVLLATGSSIPADCRINEGRHRGGPVGAYWRGSAGGKV